METTHNNDVLSDRLLVCSQCHNQFVWTAAQQRMQAQPPEYCPVCAREHDRSMNGAGANPTNGGNGYNTNNVGRFGASFGNEAHTEDYTQERPRSSGYTSGREHPLYGHGGEQYTGTVKWFNNPKGFGFITLDDGTEIFVHYSGIEGEGYKSLKQGQRVSIEVEDTDKGPQAAHVRVLEEMGDENAHQTDNIEL